MGPELKIIYKYNILERVIVEYIIPRNVIINPGAAKVDNHISRDDFFDYHPLKNVIFILLYRTLFNFNFFPLTMVLDVPRTAQCAFATNGRNNIFHKRVVFVNSFSVQADHDRHLNKLCHNQ